LAPFHSKCQVREVIQSLNQKIDTNGVFQKKGHHFFAGVGFPNLVFAGSDLAKNIFRLGYNTKKEGLLTWVAGYEYGITDKFSAGVNGTYAKGNYTYSSTSNPASFFKYDGTFYTIGVRGSYHAIVTKKWDIYTGAMVAYKKSNVNISSSGGEAAAYLSIIDLFINDSKGSFGYDVFAGARYFPPGKTGSAPQFGFFAEAGYGITVIKAGIILAKLPR